MGPTSRCNVVTEYGPALLEQFRASLDTDTSITAIVSGRIVKCELVRDHGPTHAQCVAALEYGEDDSPREIWATWTTETRPALVAAEYCQREDSCLYLDSHEGHCTPNGPAQ